MGYYKTCKNCKKRYYKSSLDENYWYSDYCNGCAIDISTKLSDKVEKHMERKRKLERMDKEEDYLDSSKCEYTRSEYDKLKSEQLKLRNHLQQLKVAIGKTNDKLKEIDIKLAIAQKEQEIRRKIRRETRVLIPALEEVKKNVNQVRTNILNTTTSENIKEEDEDSDYLPSVEEVFNDVFKTQN